MKEKEIIKGKLLNTKKFKKIFVIICFVIWFLSLTVNFASIAGEKKDTCSQCKYKQSWSGLVDNRNNYDNCLECTNSVLEMWYEDYFWLTCTITIMSICIFVLLIIQWIWDPIELFVTDKRVYGKSAFGKQVDLPLDSISSISIITFLAGISIATPSGHVSFPFIKNHKDIYNAVSDLLVERQNNKNNNKSANENSNYIEELKKLKELMNEGIITQEDFDKKKNELLK